METIGKAKIPVNPARPEMGGGGGADEASRAKCCTYHCCFASVRHVSEPYWELPLSTLSGSSLGQLSAFA